MNAVQGATLTFLHEVDVELLIQVFPETKMPEKVASGTLTFFNQKLLNFNNYGLTQQKLVQ